MRFVRLSKAGFLAESGGAALRILHLGCGQEPLLLSLGVNASDQVKGLDIDVRSLAVAKGGQGRLLVSWGVTASDEVAGLDIDESSLAVAKLRFPNRTYVRGAGECLPFADESFDRVISGVALPYMNIQKTLAEIHRILVPGGGLSFSLHLPSFTIAELLHNAFPKPLPTLFRLYVVANGLLFHCTGRTVSFLKGRTESFQTQRGIRIALNRAGFVNPLFIRVTDAVGEKFLVEARRPDIRSFGAVRAA